MSVGTKTVIPPTTFKRYGTTITSFNNKPTNLWGRQNAAQLQFHPGRHFSNFDKSPPEVAGDVMSVVTVEKVSMDVLVTFGVSRSKRSRDIRVVVFVIDDDERTMADIPCGYGVLPNKKPTIRWD